MPDAVGVPSIWLVAACRLKPAGTVPELIDHVYGVEPPVADNVVEYAAPTLPPGIEVVAICSGTTLANMFKESVCFAVCGAGVEESDTSTTKLDEPTDVGVPAMVPAGESDNPGGSVPELRLQV